MLYGWIEVGASNNSIFTNTAQEDIVIRTINNAKKVIIGNTSTNIVTAAVYITGNNVGIGKIPISGTMLDVAGITILETCQIGTPATPSSLVLNGTFTIKDTSQPFSNQLTDLIISNSNNLFSVGFLGASKSFLSVVNAQGMTLNETLTVNNEVYATAFNILSDRRFKYNICESDIYEDVRTLKRLDVRLFSMCNIAMTANRHHHDQVKGFIAQEVESAFPQAIKTNKVLKDMSDIKTIDISQIVALNTNVIKYLIDRIEHLEKYMVENK